MTLKCLDRFVVLSHDRRKIVHLDVPGHPAAGWTAQQLREAFPGDGNEPRHLIRARDSIYGDEFVRQVTAMAIEQVITGRKCPRQNACCERVIGSLRRTCTDHLTPLGERHLLRSLLEFQDDYDESRTGLALHGDSPMPRALESQGRLVSQPVLAGLHHRYHRAA